MVFMKLTKDIVKGIIIASIFWASLSTLIQAFKCPDLTGTELLIRMPRSFVCNWIDCELWKRYKSL